MAALFNFFYRGLKCRNKGSNAGIFDMTSIQDVFEKSKLSQPKTYIIAEVGINHEGSVSACEELIRAASDAGADAIKLQTIDAAKSYAENTESYRLFKTASLTNSETSQMFDLAKSLKMEIFTTSGDLETLDWVDRLQPAAHKISSGLLSCAPILEKAANLGKPLILSTGMSDASGIAHALEITARNNAKVALLQCTSIYPCPNNMLNLSLIREFSHQYDMPTGFSDHSIGINAAPLAVAAGASIIEKHFSLDTARPDFDHHISANPDEFALMVKNIRDTEEALGISVKGLSEQIKDVANKFQRRLAAARKLNAGKVLELSDLIFLRFNEDSSAIFAKNIEEVIGKELAINVDECEGISHSVLR